MAMGRVFHTRTRDWDLARLLNEFFFRGPDTAHGPYLAQPNLGLSGNPNRGPTKNNNNNNLKPIKIFFPRFKPIKAI